MASSERANIPGNVHLSADKAEGIGEKVSYVISAHHLITVGFMLREGLTPAEAINRDVELLEDHRSRAVWKMGGRRRRHANDLLGDRPEHKDKYKRTGENFLRNFNHLGDDDQVKIGNGQRDLWSEGEAVGEYSSRYYKLPPFRVMNDPIIIDVFSQLARRFGIEEEKLQLVDETAAFSNKKNPKPVKSLLTTAGVVRQVLSSEGFQKEIHLSIRP